MLHPRQYNASLRNQVAYRVRPQMFIGGSDGYYARGILKNFDYFAGKDPLSLGVDVLVLADVMVWEFGGEKPGAYKFTREFGTKADLLSLVRAAEASGTQLIVEVPAPIGDDGSAGFYDALTHVMRVMVRSGVAGFEFTGLMPRPVTKVHEHDDTICAVLGRIAPEVDWSEVLLNTNTAQGEYAVCRNHPRHQRRHMSLGLCDWSARAYSGLLHEYLQMNTEDEGASYGLNCSNHPSVPRNVAMERSRMLSILQLTLGGSVKIQAGEELSLPHESPEQKMWPAIGTQDKDPNSSLALHRRLIHLRNTSLSLREGNVRIIDERNPHVLVLVREAAFDRSYVILNFSDRSESISMSYIGKWIAGTHNIEGDGEFHRSGSLVFEPYEARIYELIRE